MFSKFYMKDLQEALSSRIGVNVLAQSSQLVELAFSLLVLKVPSHWVDLVGVSAPPATWPLKAWVQDIVLRFVFLDRVLIGGLSKTPTYWLGGFFNPLAFLSIIQQVSQVSASTVGVSLLRGWGFKIPQTLRIICIKVDIIATSIPELPYLI